MILSDTEIEALFRAITPHLDLWEAAVSGPDFHDLPIGAARGPRMLQALEHLNHLGARADGQVPLQRALSRLKLQAQEAALIAVIDRCLAAVEKWKEQKRGEDERGVDPPQTDPPPPAFTVRPWRDKASAASARNLFLTLIAIGLAANVLGLVVQNTVAGVVVFIVDGLLMLIGGIVVLGGIAVGLQARQWVTRHWIFLTVWGVIAVTAMAIVCIHEIQRRETLEHQAAIKAHEYEEGRITRRELEKVERLGLPEIVIETIGAGFVATWILGIGVAVSGLPEGIARYGMRHIGPFPCEVRIDGRRPFVLKLDVFRASDALHERMTCKFLSSETVGELEAHANNGDGEPSTAEVSETAQDITCAISERLLTSLRVGEDRRLRIAFEDRCAELYFECILVELAQSKDAHKIVVDDRNYGAKARRILSYLA